MAATAANDTVEVRVRMYRQGLGDCFLLTFTEGRNTAHMLIDCGVLLGTGDAEERMRAVAESIRETTGDHLDVLVATHEHWDHLSGFVQARSVFENLVIDNVWLGWTEDPGNETAKSLREKRRQTVHTLHLARERLRELAPASKSAAGSTQRLDRLLGFFGDIGGAGLGAAGGSGGSTADALAWVASRDASIHYQYPGRPPLRLEGIENVRIYVLGPPENTKLLRRSRPSEANPETFEIDSADDLNTAFVLAARVHCASGETPAPDELDEFQRTQPFDPKLRIDRSAATNDPFYQEAYGFDKTHPESWRWIEDDWMETAGQLALKLDSNTNNTSLALAIELLPSGDILLFPGDAQVGNWLSWQDLSWKIPGLDGSLTVTGPDLLRRTILYKVGHHASHNATLREKGLELMSSPELTALIPVNEETAKSQGWSMPFPPLYESLLKKTEGRILQADKGMPTPVEGANAARWKAFGDRVRFGGDLKGGPLYVEYTIGGSGKVAKKKAVKPRSAPIRKPSPRTQGSEEESR
jgi:hypothetical protein